MMQQLQVILLLELPEQLIGTARAWRRCDQGGVAIVDGIRLGCGSIAMEDEAVRGTVTAPSGGRQRRLFLRSQRQQFPAEVTAGGFVAEQFGHAAFDLGPARAAMAALDRGRDLLQSAADLGDRLITMAATDFLIRSAEAKQNPAGNGFCGIRIDQFMAEHREVIMLAW